MENNIISDEIMNNLDNKNVKVLSIELNENNQKFLKIYPDSKPEELAYEFCLENALDFESLKILTKEIKNALNQNNDSIKRTTSNGVDNNFMNLNSDEIIGKRLNDNFIFQNNILHDKNFINEGILNEDLIKESKKIRNNEELNKKYNKNPEKYKYNDSYLKKAKNQNSNNLIYQNNKSLNQLKQKILKRNYNDNYPLVVYKKIDYPYKGIYKLNKKYQNTNNIKRNIKKIKKSQSCTYLIPTQKSIPKNTIRENYNNDIINSLLKNNYKTFEPKSTSIKKKTKSKNKIRPLSSSHSSTLLNFGERLYLKGIKLKEKSKEKIDKLKDELENEEKLNCTFQPKINNNLLYSISNINNKKLSNNNDNIINYKEYIDNKIEYLKGKYKDNKEYSFIPEINKKSKLMDNILNSQTDTDRFEKLYSNYKKQKLNLENLTNRIYDKKKMFQPKVNKYNCPYTNMNFSDRQNVYLSRSLERKKVIKDQVENPFDTHTGQKFFSPCINSNYKRDEKYNQQEYLNILYYDFEKNIQKKKQLAKELQALECPNNESYTNILSNDIFENKKLNSIKKIFKILDKDQDGIISKFSIFTKGLDNKILKILSPIIKELKEENESLSEKEFVIACMRLYEMLCYTDKKEIVNFGIHKKQKNNYWEQEFSFKPKINKYNFSIYRKDEIESNYEPNYFFNDNQNEKNNSKDECIKNND